MKQLKTSLALFIPILVLGLWAWRLYNQQRQGVEVELPIIGFDPRDPISGHYLSFRLAMGLKDPCRPTGGPLIESTEERCLCLDNGKQPQPAWAGSCSQKPAECSLYLKGHCEWSGFLVGLERYYFPEGDARWLLVVPPKSSVRLAVAADGQALLKEFRPEGRDYDEWIAQQKKERPAP